LEAHNWPGNVRELEHVIERAVVLAESDRLTLQDLPFAMQGDQELDPAPASLSLEDYTNNARKYYIAKVLRDSDGKKVDAARKLQVNRSYLFQLIKQLGIDT
jgi:DNA-binding NtrC family response regulator